MGQSGGNNGFQPVVRNDRFLCARITHSSQYSFGMVRTVKRHLTSQEVFVLIQGSAVLLTAAPDGSERQITELKRGEVCCVEAGYWHYLAVSEDALLFVTEGSDVSAQNTETMELEEPYEILCGVSAAQ